jgi:hypothetical protein
LHAGVRGCLRRSLRSVGTVEGIGFGLGFSVMVDPIRAQMIASKGEYNWGGWASTVFW